MNMYRDSVATYLLEEGVDIRYVQRPAGPPQSIVTTEIYTHVALKSRVIERHPRKTIVRRTLPSK